MVKESWGNLISQIECLSILTAIFSGGPGLADITISQFWIVLELGMVEVMVTTGAIRHSKLQSDHHHQQTNIQLFTGRIPFLSPNQQCQSTEGKHFSIECELHV